MHHAGYLDDPMKNVCGHPLVRFVIYNSPVLCLNLYGVPAA